MDRARTLSAWIENARERTFALVADLSDEQLFGPRLAIVNPLHWEIGHVAWFQERWFLRHVHGQTPLVDRADELYDSIAIPHDTRWDLPLPSRARTLEYLRRVRDAVLERLARGELGPDDGYFVELGVLHEDMHDEAFTYTRQTHGFAPPPGAEAPDRLPAAGPLPGDVEVPGGRFRLGAEPGRGFVFDNEKWAHEHELAPFAIARAPVTQAEFAEFVDGGGYENDALWTPEGLAWKTRERAAHPVYWKREDGVWLRRHFDVFRPLEPHRPVVHVCAHEAEAYCRWAKRRLPSELEWEFAASGPDKRRYPWGDEPPTAEHANLELAATGPLDVAALPAGDSVFGCRQMIGNVWEWTSSRFTPYPGFVVDPYREYSEPWFHTHRVLRGGCFATRRRLIRNSWRNFYPPDRRDVLAGFRTCRL